MTRAAIAARIIVSAVLLSMTALYLYQAQPLDPLAAYVPLLAGSSSLILLTLILLREIYRLTKFGAGERTAMGQTIEGDSELELTRPVGIASLKYLGSMLVLLAAVWQAGLLISGPIFTAVFLKLDSRVKLWIALAVGVGVYATFVALNTYLEFALP